jgi:hypothetical protein
MRRSRRLIALAQLLQANGKNPFKVRAYRRAAQNLQALDDARVFKKLQITTVLEILLDDADILAAKLEQFLKAKCAVRRVAVAGEVRRRVEVVGEIAFLIATDDFLRTREMANRDIRRFCARGAIRPPVDRAAPAGVNSRIRLRIRSPKLLETMRRHIGEVAGRLAQLFKETGIGLIGVNVSRVKS